MIKFGNYFINEKTMPHETKQTFDNIIQDYRFNWKYTTVMDFLSSHNVIRNEDLLNGNWLKPLGIFLLPNGNYVSLNDGHVNTLADFFRKNHPFDFDEFKEISNNVDNFCKDTKTIKVNADGRSKDITYAIMAPVTKQQLSTIRETEKEIGPNAHTDFFLMDGDGEHFVCRQYLELLKKLREFGFLNVEGSA